MKRYPHHYLPMLLLAVATQAGAQLLPPVTSPTTPTTPSGVQEVHDKDVFEQNAVIVKSVQELNATVQGLNSTIKSAVVRTRNMGETANTQQQRMVLKKHEDDNDMLRTIYNRVTELGCSKPEEDGSMMPEEQLFACKRIESNSYKMISMLRENMQRSQQRSAKIQELLEEVDKTGEGNLKEVADLTARIQAETALLQTEKMMMDMAVANNEQELRLYYQYQGVLQSEGKGDPDNNGFSLGKK